MSDQDMDRPATKAELAATKTELKGDIVRLERRFELFQGAVIERFIALETVVKQLPAQLARAVKAANEEMRDWMRAFEDRYRDLPPRMERVEAKVFAPRRRRR